MILGTHNKQSRETRRIKIDYDQWLAVGETLVNVYIRSDVSAAPPADAPAVEALTGIWELPPFAVSAERDTGDRTATATITGGVPFTDYLVTLLATTSTGQIKEDEIMVSVQEVV